MSIHGKVYRDVFHTGIEDPDGLRRSYLDAIGGGQTLQEDGVARSEAPAPQPRVRDEQPVEGIASPAQIDRFREPRRRRQIVENPSRVLGDGRHAGRAQPDSPGFDEELKLQQICRRDIEPPRPARQRTHTRTILVEPDKSVCIEEDHERRRRAVNRTPFLVQPHCH